MTKEGSQDGRTVPKSREAIEVARELRAATGNVSRWYGHAMAAAGEMEEIASPLLLQLKRSSGRVRSKQQSVRYQVAVDD